MAPMASTDHEKTSSTVHNDPQCEQFAAQIHGQLRRILSSRLFSRSHQAAHLLTFLVEEALSFDASSRRSNLKEYSIAVHVFGRSVGFDPSSDNIVRVEVRRVRSKLESYYAEEGSSDPILISIPKGTYVPVFQTRDYSDFDLSGHTISHYELIRRQCANKWQTLYEANCLHLNRSVIVILPSRLTLEDQARRQRLVADTQGGAIDHPNVAAIHDVETTSERVVIATANLPGRRLREVVEQGTFSDDLTFAFARELATALASGHSKGASHGILSPDWITWEEAYPHVHTLPFRLSSLVDIDYSAYDGFRAPEWKNGYTPDLASDIWVFGALVWFVHVGAPPPVTEAVLEGAPEFSSLPRSLAKVITKCLQADPSSRYASANEVLEDILQVSEEPAEQIEDARTSIRQPVGSHKTLTLTAVLLGVFAIVFLAAIAFRQKAANEANLRIVVLPLDNVGGGPENNAYCRVIAELLAAKLARLPGAQVVSSRSIDPRHDQVSTEFLQQKLGVQYAVDGTLSKNGTAFQATVRLIRVADGSYAWTDSYSGAWTGISAHMDELAEKSAQTLGLVVQREQKKLPPRPTAGSEAYDEWLKGRFAVIEYWNTFNTAHYEDAERRLRRALEIQPGYVDALSDLGQLYLSAAYPPKGNQKELLDRAQDLAELAVTLGPENGRAQTVLGGVYTDTGRPRLAMPHLLRALEMTPHDPNPHNFLSLAYEALGFWEAALFERDRAVERDPLLGGIQRGRVLLLARLGRFEEATKKADAFGPGSPGWGTIIARILLVKGEPGQAEAVLTKTNTEQSRDPSTSVEMLMALAKASQGDLEIAKLAVKQLKSSERQRGIYFALLCALAGEKDMLIDEISNHTYYRNYRWLVGEPLLRPYRGYAPYQKLVRDLYEDWQRNLGELGRYLPVQPAKLPHPNEYLSQ